MKHHILTSKVLHFTSNIKMIFVHSKIFDKLKSQESSADGQELKNKIQSAIDAFIDDPISRYEISNQVNSYQKKKSYENNDAF